MSDPQSTRAARLERLISLRNHLNRVAMEGWRSVADHIVPVFASPNDEALDAIGTGLLLAIGPSRFFVSAAHVSDDIEPRPPVLLSPSGPVALLGTPKRFRDLDRPRSQDRIDLAAFRLSETEADHFPPTHFLQSTQLAPREWNAKPGFYGLYGFPDSHIKSDLSTLSKVMTPFIFSGPAPGEHRLHETEAERHFLAAISLNKKRVVDPTGRLVTPKDLHGISGAPIWRLDLTNGHNHGHKPHVVAFVTRQHPSFGKAFRGTRVNALLAGIEAEWPGTVESTLLDSGYPISFKHR